MALKIVRQGDVLLVEVGTLPQGAVRLPIEDRRVVLALGEVTGHAHAIYEPMKAVKFEASGQTFLEVLDSCQLRHEEHAPLNLEKTIYKILIQTEYTPGGISRVQD